MVIRRFLCFCSRKAFVVGLGLFLSGCGNNPLASSLPKESCSREMMEISHELLYGNNSRRYTALNKLREYDYQEPSLDISNIVPIVVRLLADRSVANWLPRITIGEEAASLLCQIRNDDARELAFPLIVSLTTNDNPFVRANAAFAFHCKDRTTRALPYLLTLSRDCDQSVIKAAQKSLQSFSVSDLPKMDPNSYYYYSEKDNVWHYVDSEGHDSVFKSLLAPDNNLFNYENVSP